MDDVLRSALCAAVYDRLDYLDTIVHDADAPSRAALADSAIPMLTRAWRELLCEHEPDKRGRCRACSPRWTRRVRRCSVWQLAHRHLIPDVHERPAAGDDKQTAGRHALRPASLPAERVGIPVR
jgi:hypothetical protein